MTDINKKTVEIVIQKDIFKEDLLEMIVAFVKNLQYRFDISPELIKTMIHDREFVKYANEMYKKSEEKVLYNLETNGDIVELKEIYESNHPLEILTKYFGWELEECGYVIESYENGYIKFCNLNKFEHENKLPESIKTGKIKQHEFVRKTYQQMIDEKLFNIKFKTYLEFKSIVLDQLIKWFDNKLKVDYKIYKITVKDYTKTMQKWLQNNNQVFKGKMGLINSVSYIDLYIPEGVKPPTKAKLLHSFHEGEKLETAA